MLPDNHVPPPLGLIKPSKSDIVYTLTVVQHPERARCCGFGEKDRRPIDPPPIVQLKASIHGREVSLNAADTKLFALHCDLYSADTLQECTLVCPPPYHLGFPVKNLLGSLVSNAYCLNDLERNPGVYFVFPDLSVRTEGSFTLRFRFLDLDAGEPMTMSTTIQTEVFSNPFKVDTPKNKPRSYLRYLLIKVSKSLQESPIITSANPPDRLTVTSNVVGQVSQKLEQFTWMEHFSSNKQTNIPFLIRRSQNEHQTHTSLE